MIENFAFIKSKKWSNPYSRMKNLEIKYTSSQCTMPQTHS